MGIGKGFRVAKILGIDVYLDLSWFLIFGLVTFSLASGYFPKMAPGTSQASFWIVGFLTSAAFFGSVVFHEFAHALTAKNFGIKTKRVTLFFLGGIAQIEKDVSSAKAEFLIAFAGPVSSVALAGLFWGFAYFGEGFLPVIVLVGLAYLVLINLLLAGFNLIPGFPLDGGRILRAVLWAYLRNEAKANRFACLAGQGFGYLFMLGGLIFVLTGDFFQGVWFVFIGWFLLGAAENSMRFYALQAKLTGVKIGRIVAAGFCRPVTQVSMNSGFCSVEDDAKEVLARMLSTGKKETFTVYGMGRPVAVITQNDITEYAIER